MKSKLIPIEQNNQRVLLTFQIAEMVLLKNRFLKISMLTKNVISKANIITASLVLKNVNFVTIRKFRTVAKKQKYFISEQKKVHCFMKSHLFENHEENRLLQVLICRLL
ncbi:MAG TPA: hypothetical protein DIW26_02490 [Ruminococcus sp.]|nr:hypothetical protein [Ruminococcus sp.]